MTGKSKSGFGFKSGFRHFSMKRIVKINEIFNESDLDLNVGPDLDLNIAGFAHH